MAQVNLEDCRKAGNVYRTNLEQLYMIEETMGKEVAGEFAKALVETVLCGHMSERNPTFEIMLMATRDASAKDKSRYEAKVVKREAERIANMQLKEIAEMLSQGRTQRDIAGELKIAVSTLANRIQIIKSDYPHLLGTSSELLDEEKGEGPQNTPSDEKDGYDYNIYGQRIVKPSAAPLDDGEEDFDF